MHGWRWLSLARIIFLCGEAAHSVTSVMHILHDPFRLSQELTFVKRDVNLSFLFHPVCRQVLLLFRCFIVSSYARLSIIFPASFSNLGHLGRLRTWEPLLIVEVGHLLSCFFFSFHSTPSLEDILSRLWMASSMKPGLAPPPGVTPDFVSPYTLQPYQTLTVVACIIVTTVIVAARLYTVSDFPRSSIPVPCLDMSRKKIAGSFQIQSRNCLAALYSIMKRSLIWKLVEDLCNKGSEMGGLWVSRECMKCFCLR